MKNGTRGYCDLGQAGQEVEYQALASAVGGGGARVWHVSHICVLHIYKGKVLFFFSICVGSDIFLLVGGSGSPVCLSCSLVPSVPPGEETATVAAGSQTGPF